MDISWQALLGWLCYGEVHHASQSFGFRWGATWCVVVTVVVANVVAIGGSVWWRAGASEMRAVESSYREDVIHVADHVYLLSCTLICYCVCSFVVLMK